MKRKKISKLTFEHQLLSKQKNVSSSDKPYIDFLIDGVSLLEIAGDRSRNIGKFGWNSDREERELIELREGLPSGHHNRLHSFYVCPECGDEGCGALMADVQLIDNLVVWNHFVWSTGDDNLAQNKIEIEPIYFDRLEYLEAMRVLSIAIKKTRS